MSDVKEAVDGKKPTIDQLNNEQYLKFMQRYWQYDKASYEKIVERVNTKNFDPEFAKYLKDSPDQRVRWDIDFTETALQGFFETSDEAFKMFKRKFAHALNELKKKYEVEIKYSNFMENKIIFKKNETKIKKVLEVMYAENSDLYRADRGLPSSSSVKNDEVSSSSSVKNDEVSSYIVKAFEEIGTYKKPFKKLQLVLSLNMIDWLLASTGGNISSCLNMEGGGHKYWSGLGFLAGDPNRAMLYISDGTKKTFEGMTVDSCITRSWVILTASNHKSIIRWYTQDILPVDAIQSITGDSSWRKGMDCGGKNKITPIFLESGITTTIYVDEGCWERVPGEQMFAHTLTNKGCYQMFTEDLQPARNFDFRPPWGQSVEWKISSFKRAGISINDQVPIALCSSCGKKKTYVKNSGSDGPICFSCFNKDFFMCDGGCESYQNKKKDHYEGYAMKDRTKVLVKLCSSCFKDRYKKCECCGLPIINNSMKTAEGGTVCMACVENKSNGYKKCSICGKVSKSKVSRVYDNSKNCLTDLCSDHMISEKTDIERNVDSFVRLLRSPAEKMASCKTCGSLIPKSILFVGNCPSCKLSKGSEILEF